MTTQTSHTIAPDITAALKFLTGATTDLTAIGVDILQSETAPHTAEHAASLATLIARHQAIVARCAQLMNAFITAKNAAEAAYNQNTLLSAQANEAWQLHREQSHLASQLHDRWHDALRARQDLFAAIHKVEGRL